MIHGHGSNTSQYPGLVVDFSSNGWYKGFSEELATVLSENIPSIANYPEPDAISLKNKIATYFGLDTANTIITNGSTEAFYLIAQTFSGRKSTIVTPGFAEYSDACELFHHKIVYRSNTNGWQGGNFENQIVWFANPNNPDAKTLTLRDIAGLLKANPSSLFVLDEAYIELCYGIETAIPLIAEHSNLIIVRSFTKAFSMPGIRLGYILSSRKNIKKISSFLMPWNVNTLAIAAGIYITENMNRLLPDKKSIWEESHKLQKEIEKTRKMKVYPSNCNFFLVQSLHRPACELKAFLVNEFGILIRDASNFKGLDSSYFRVAVQKPEMNNLLVEGIKSWLRL